MCPDERANRSARSAWTEAEDDAVGADGGGRTLGRPEQGPEIGQTHTLRPDERVKDIGIAAERTDADDEALVVDAEGLAGAPVVRRSERSQIRGDKRRRVPCIDVDPGRGENRESRK